MGPTQVWLHPALPVLSSAKGLEALIAGPGSAKQQHDSPSCLGSHPCFWPLSQGMEPVRMGQPLPSGFREWEGAGTHSQISASCNPGWNRSVLGRGGKRLSEYERPVLAGEKHSVNMFILLRLNKAHYKIKFTCFILLLHSLNHDSNILCD